MLHLILGGAAVYRCDNCLVLNPALAAEVAILGRKRLFPQPAKLFSRAAQSLKKCGL